MLIDFAVENFRSYREEKRLSLVASSANELPENSFQLPESDISLLKTAAVYGPNASGKSNLIAAMYCLGDALEGPTNRPLSFSIPFSPFALDRSSSEKPTRFAVSFFAESVLYRYGVALRPEGVKEEHLTAYPHGRPQEWFRRSEKEITFNRTYLKGQKQSLLEVTPADRLFLAVAAAFEHPQLTVPAKWLASNLRNRLDFRASSPYYRRPPRPEEITARLIHEDKTFGKWADDFVAKADIGIKGIEIELTAETVRRPIITRLEGSKEPVRSIQEIKEEHYEPYFIHSGEEGVTARFGLSDESLGTRRLFGMLAPFYEVLKAGQLAVVDELSASLHPLMVRRLVELFHGAITNPLGAQLVFATHDTPLMSGRLFRRDQIWLTQKDKIGATDLYSLHDIKGIREDGAFEQGYLRGRYGAIPFFRHFDFPDTSDEGKAENQ